MEIFKIISLDWPILCGFDFWYFLKSLLDTLLQRQKVEQGELNDLAIDILDCLTETRMSHYIYWVICDDRK